MKKWSFRAIVLAIACVFNLNMVRADITLDGEQAAVVASDCNAGCCGNQGGWDIEFDATFLRFHSDRTFSQDNVFGFDFAPRVTVGFTNCDGLGVRGRWWYYHHDATGGVAGIPNITTDIFAQNIDLEVYEDLQLSCCTSLEWSAGLRVNQFKGAAAIGGVAIAPGFSFSAPGLVLGAKITRQAFGGAIYAGVRQSWLMSTDDIGGVGSAFDVSRTISEGFAGYEYSSCLSNGSVLTLRGGVEMQNWSQYENTFNILGGDEVGFGGFAIGASLTY